jgi:SHS2 domain-containing protein
MLHAMGKDWRTFEHPADLGLEARADSLAELFEALAEGLARQVCPRGVRSQDTLPVRAEADDLESLAVEFLGEVLRLFHLRRFLVAGVRVERIEATSLSASAGGEAYDPARHELGPEIKAVTYHHLKVAHEPDGWVATVLLDL